MPGRGYILLRRSIKNAWGEMFGSVWGDISILQTTQLIITPTQTLAAVVMKMYDVQHLKRLQTGVFFLISQSTLSTTNHGNSHINAYLKSYLLKVFHKVYDGSRRMTENFKAPRNLPSEMMCVNQGEELGVSESSARAPIITCHSQYPYNLQCSGITWSHKVCYVSFPLYMWMLC